MPYAPGINDISGTLRAQGKIAQAQGIAGGMQEGYQAYAQNKARNAALTGQNEALLKAFSVDDETKKYAPDGIDKFIEKSIKGGGLSLNDSMTLNGMLNTALATKGHIQDQKLKAQEGEMRKQQILASQQMLEQEKLDQEGMASALKFALTPSEEGGEVKFDVNRFLQASGNTKLSPKAYERIDSIVRIASPGKTQAPDSVFASQEELEKSRPASSWDYTAVPRPDGSVAVVGGKFSPRSSPMKTYASPDEASAIEYEKERAKQGAALVADAQGKVEQYHNVLDQSARARDILQKGGAQGKGRELATSMQQAINFVAPGTFDTTKEEALQKTYADMALAAAAKMKGQGTITQPERELLAKSVAQFGNTDKAAVFIMDFSDAVARREIAKAEYFAQIEADKKRVTASDNVRYYRENPLGKFMTPNETPPIPAPRAEAPMWDDSKERRLNELLEMRRKEREAQSGTTVK